MQEISLYLFSAPIDKENPSNEIIEISAVLPILSATLNKFKKQILYLQQQIEACIHELYLYSFHLNKYICHHSNYLSIQDDNYDEQYKALILIQLEKQLKKRIFYILNEEDTKIENFSSFEYLYDQIKNEVKNQIFTEEKENLLTKTLSIGKQNYMDIINAAVNNK
eukprot:jgi/Orpsp1_1/1188123/evm.model.d7180000062599.1